MLSWRNNLFTVEFHLLVEINSISVPLARSFPGRSKGSDLIAHICSYLKICEYHYFGLLYKKPSGQLRWLNEEKTISRQFKSNRSVIDLFFQVKFHVPNPDRLEYEATRYQFFLQAKRDILNGVLMINNYEVLAKLFALVLQSELGNYSPERDTENYSSQFNFIPLQSFEFEFRAQEIHKTLKNISSGEAEWRFLREVKNLDFYGMKTHLAFGESDREFEIGISANGLYIFYEQSRRANHSWSRVTKVERSGHKVSFFTVGRNPKPDCLQFKCSSKDAAKHLFDCANQHKKFNANYEINDLSGKFSHKVVNESNVYAQLESSLKFERCPMKRQPKRKLPDRILYVQSNEQSSVSRSSGIFSNSGLNLANRNSIMLPGSRGLRNRTPRNRVAKYYVPRSSAGSDSEALNGNRVRTGGSAGFMRNVNSVSSVPISRKVYRMSAFDIDCASDMEFQSEFSSRVPDLNNSKRFKHANDLNKNMSESTEDQMHVAQYHSRQVSQSSRIGLKIQSSRTVNLNLENDRPEKIIPTVRIHDSEARPEGNKEPKSPLPTYEQHMNSRNQIKRSNSAKYRDENLAAVVASDVNGNVLSPILPTAERTIFASKSAVNVKPTSSFARLKQLSKQKETSSDSPNLYPELQNGKENLKPDSRNVAGDNSAESDCFQISSTPCSPKTRSVRSFIMNEPSPVASLRKTGSVRSTNNLKKEHSSKDATSAASMIASCVNGIASQVIMQTTADTSGFERRKKER
ncbi:band 4.1-like protein 4A isoform X2 [Symsagittifera roscoffensis]|uniref:band 4.1-like protein 4A isoform X2 n=1 Tax=Symsagittifera roscoffensis TaxID=84072 RepID=UPI00307BDBF3